MKSGAHLDSPYHDVAGVYLPSAYGVDIESEQVFQQELHGIVDDMKVKLVDEKKILEGTLNPEYGKGDWGLPQIEKVYTTPDEMVTAVSKARKGCASRGVTLDSKTNTWVREPCDCGKGCENELSNSNPVEEQWKSDSLNGCSTIDPTLTSIQDSSNSSCIAELFNRSCPIVRLRRLSSNSPKSSCSGNSAASGTETDVMNESSECTVPMTSELTPGTPNEAR